MSRVNEQEKLYYYMDDTSIPYEPDENPFSETEEDMEFDKRIIEKYCLEDTKQQKK